MLERPNKNFVDQFSASGSVRVPRREVGMRVVSENLTRPTNFGKPVELKNVHKIQDFTVRKHKQPKKNKDLSNSNA